ncbi:MAG: hypothetical protein GXO26_08995 [Crenarchaeota archaeon]|nr:hypothetical protein [Thermoproteota archaeon]
MVVLIATLCLVTVLSLPHAPHLVKISYISSTCGVEYSCTGDTCTIAGPELCIFYIYHNGRYFTYLGEEVKVSCRRCIIYVLCPGCGATIYRGLTVPIYVTPLGLVYSSNISNILVRELSLSLLSRLNCTRIILTGRGFLCIVER